MNYFELFGIPVSLMPDKNKLARTYFELQKKYHPDFFTLENEAEQAEALELSSQVNKALHILRNPDETIKYVLRLKGLLEEEEKYQLPPGFLMEVMELNEELGEGSKEQIEKLEAAIREPVCTILENYDENKTPVEELLKVKEYYFKKKYLDRILERMGG